MVSKQIVQLVAALKERGYENRLQWQESKDNIYETIIGSAILRIREEENFDRAPDYYLDIMRDDRVLESVSDTELAPYLRDSYQAMAEIYTSARAKARGIDEIVSDVLKQLEAGGSSPGTNASGFGDDFEDEIPF